MNAITTDTVRSMARTSRTAAHLAAVSAAAWPYARLRPAQHYCCCHPR